MVVVGSGVAAVSLAEALRDNGYRDPVTIVGAEPGLPYDRPPLSKDLLRGSRSPDDSVLRTTDWYRERDIRLRTGRTVLGIEPDRGRAHLDDGTFVEGEIVVLATGGVARRLPAPLVRVEADHPALHTLRSVADARRLRAALGPGVRLVVIGAGLIGAEVAASAVARGAAVTMVDPSDRPLARAVGDDAAALLHERHADAGVVTIRAGVAAIEPGPGAAVDVVLSEGAAIEADAVLIGVGLVPVIELAVGAGLDTDGGVLVGDGYRTSHPRVYAIGDVARRMGPDGPQPRVEHWDNAVRSAQVAAAAIAGVAAPPPRAPWFWSDRYDQHLEMVGHPDPADTVVVRQDGSVPADGFTALYLREDRCTAAVTINRPLDARAAQRLIDERVPVTVDQVADRSRSLRDLLRAVRSGRA